MAIDLASKTVAFEFESMLPLDMLAAVATEKLKNEITSPDDKSILTDSKKTVKKPYSDVMSIKDVKLLSPKALVDRFSELDSDEMNKKYTFKCIILPDKCNVSFKSYGSEKKAWERMKLHLVSHINQLKFESNLILQCKKTSKKTTKKIMKTLKMQNCSLSHSKCRTESRKLKKSKKIVFHEKSVLSYNSKISPKLKKMAIDDKKIFATKSVPIPHHFPRIKSENPWEIDLFESKPISFDDSLLPIVKSEPGELNEIKEEENLEVKESKVFDSMADLIDSKQSIFDMHDHNYTAIEGVAFERPMDIRRSSPESQKIVRSKIPPQFIIKTPPFPHVHIPLLPDVAEIKEFNNDCSPSERDYTDYECRLPLSLISDQSHETKQTYNIKKIQRFKKRETSISVLECVENIVDVKPSLECLTKDYPSPDSIVENRENMQRDLALKLIAKLHSKRKKQYHGPLECQICEDKHFTALATLIHHYRSHAGIKPYACNICASTFTRQHSLNYHMLIHQNLSRFKCAFCGRMFRHPSHYKEHLRRHTGETPFRCHDCNLHFKTRNTFKRHLKIRHHKLLTAHGIEDLIEGEIKQEDCD